MLHISLVGSTNSLQFIKAIEGNPSLKLSGIFDPSFQFDVPKNLRGYPVYYSFAELLKHSQAIAFSSVENTYFPFIERAVQFSKPVFLQSTYYLSLEEHQHLVKLKDEAGVVIQLYHPFLYQGVIDEYAKRSKSPLYIDCHSSWEGEKNLLPIVRKQVSGIIPFLGNNIKRVTANTFSSLSEVPDIIQLRIDFNNGNMANIHVNSVEKGYTNTLRVFEYQSNFQIDLRNNELQYTNNQSNPVLIGSSEEYSHDKLLKKQFDIFYKNVVNHTQPRNTIENECISYKIMEKVKEKLRVCIDI
ncbi:MAG: hypothetical protein A2W88_01150 [Bacteroidetes bacterium GWF2_40_13]|jgi:hypothetical protein|nr:MAG: hypothetical protein A2W88_01150 [Bacteroidetes bacterium GWF2_40_13]HBX86500.1 hypothetical protein [Marinilabiliales bacterium]